MRGFDKAQAALVIVAALVLAPSRSPRAESKAELPARLEALTAKVAALRGLPVRHPIAHEVIAPEALRERLAARLAGDASADVRRSLLLARFGLVSAPEPRALVFELLAKQIAGFYDSERHQLLLSGWDGQEVATAAVLARELAQALLDQHYRLETFLAPGDLSADALAARSALTAGDSTTVMFELVLGGAMRTLWSSPHLRGLLGPFIAAQLRRGALGRVPVALREVLEFPSAAGVEFVLYFRRHYPWRRIDAIYRKPPLSTEHILHPQTYEAYERPVEVVPQPIAALAGYRLVHQEVRGELGARLALLAHGVTSARAKRAAAGWGGDRLALYARADRHTGEGSIAVYFSVWDHEADALEFAEAAFDAAASLANGPLIAGHEKRAQWRLAGPTGETVLLERRGTAVVWIVGAGEAVAAPMAAQVFARWTVRR